MSEPICPDDRSRSCRSRQDEDDDQQHHAEYDGELDPRVQEELERLNQSSNQINSFEVSLNQARNDYRFLLQVNINKNIF